jgi:hypothetical protein
MSMLGWNTYRQQLTMKVGEIAKLSPDTIKGYQALRAAGQLVGIGRWATGSAKLLRAATVITLLASPYSLADPAGSSQRMAQLQHACAVVMGLDRPGNLYDTCIRSLSDTLSELDQARVASTNQTACVQEGHKIGSPAYAVCVVNAQQSPAGQTAHRSSVH